MSDATLVQAVLDLPRRMKAHRETHGLTMAQLGEQIGVNASTVHRIEHGKGYSIDNLLAILAYFEADERDGEL